MSSDSNTEHPLQQSLTPDFGFIHVRSQFSPQEETFPARIQSFSQALSSLGGKQWAAADISTNQPVLYFMDTGGTEEALLKLHQARCEHYPAEQILLVAHPGFNSLPAALEVLARLQQDQSAGHIIFLKDPQDGEGLKQISEAILNLTVKRRLSRARIGLIGEPSNWLVASSPEALVLKKTWGPEVIPIAMDELTAIMGRLKVPANDPVLRDLVSGARETREPSAQELQDVVGVYQALKQLVQIHGLLALALRCFDLILGLRTTGCFGLSQLTDEGIMAGCEGDLVSTMGMLWARELLGEIPWMANPAHLDQKRNTIKLAHCTVPRTLLQSYELRSHFESGLAVGIQGDLPLGPVTLLRIGGRRMEALWLGEGRLMNVGKAEDLCRTQVDIQLSRGKVKDLLQRPLGNHLVMIRGYHARRLHAWWEMMIS